MVGHSTGTNAHDATTTSSKPRAARNGSHRPINITSHRDRHHYTISSATRVTSHGAMGRGSTTGRTAGSI